MDASSNLSRACDLYVQFQSLRAENDWEALDEWRNRRAMEWFHKLRVLIKTGPFAEADGVFLDADALRKSYRWVSGGNAMKQNLMTFSRRLRAGVGETTGRLLIAAHEAAHNLLRDKRWMEFLHAGETSSNHRASELEDRFVRGNSAFDEMFADALAVLTVGAYLGKPQAVLADRLAFARRPVFAASALRRAPKHLTAAALERLARNLRQHGTPHTPAAEVLLALEVAGGASADAK